MFTTNCPNEGFVGLYRGLTPAIATTPFYIGIQLSTYQFFKKKEIFFLFLSVRFYRRYFANINVSR